MDVRIAAENGDDVLEFCSVKSFKKAVFESCLGDLPYKLATCFISILAY